MIVIEKSNLFPDERNRSLIEAAVESDRPIFLHLPKGSLSEEIFQMGRHGPQTFQVRGESLQRSLTRHRMNTPMVGLLKPPRQGLIELS
jgi:hypothetical protein